MQVVLAGLIGLVFGLGILVAGMGNPAKVLNFFDVAGKWDPSLAFVMAGAIAISGIGYKFAFRRPRPLLGGAFHVPTARDIDAKLLGGSAIFGIGWGLSGFCPGGVVPMLATGHIEPIIFVLGLLAGLVIARNAISRQLTWFAKPVS